MTVRHLILATLAAVVLAPAAMAATPNVPDGLVGLWLLENGASTEATIGNDLEIVYDGGSGSELNGTNTQIGTESQPFLFQGTGIIQDTTWGAIDITHGIAPNGGGAKVNEYTWMMDYKQTSELGNWASLFDTYDGNAHDGGNSDGDLFTHPSGTIGVGDLGYSTLTYVPGEYHRIVMSVDNGSFARVYIDGELYLDAAGQAIDGRFALAPTFHLLVDNAWEGGWGLVDTIMMWDRALTTSEVEGLGMFSDPANNNFPTPLILPDSALIPEPSSIAIVGVTLLGGAAVWRRRR